MRKKHKTISVFQEIFGEIYSYYSRSSKNVAEINEISLELGKKFKKIGKIFSVRWTASSFTAVTAVLSNYEALAVHFQEKQLEIFQKITTLNFVKTLLIMHEALEIISSLSKQLQTPQLTLIDAHRLIINCANKLKRCSLSEDENIKLISSTMIFENIKLYQDDAAEIDRLDFFKDLSSEILKRSMSTINRKNTNPETQREYNADYVEIFGYFKILERQKFESNMIPKSVEDKLKRAASHFGLDQKKLMSQYELFQITDSCEISKLSELKKLNDISQTIVVSSADAERGFSTMNDIMVKKRNKLDIVNLSSLMLISLIKMPINKFAPEKYVQKWLLTHNDASSFKNTRKAKKEKKLRYENLFDLL